MRLHGASGVAALAMVACGPEPTSQTPTVGSTAAGTAASSTTTGMASGSTTATPTCEDEALLGDDPSSDLELRFTNATAETVWLLRWSCERFGFQVTAVDGQAIGALGPWCDSLCGAVVEGECDFWCEDHCDPILVRVQPQATYAATWDRRIWETAEVPPACSTCARECLRPERAPAGTYTASVVAYAGCLDPSGADCTCSDPGTGNCEQFFGSPQGPAIDVSASFELPTDSTVALVLD